MATPQVPDFWPMALGSNADTVEIPDTTPAGEGIPSFTSLFPILTQIDPTAGGVFIQRTWMNGLFQLLGNNIWYLQHGCLFPWNSTFDYPVGAHVLGSDNNEYVAVQENTGQNPTQDPTNIYWLRADAGDGVPVGTIVWSAATQAPNGYLLCNGATVGRSTYSALFAAIGTTYGAGDGSTTFGLPNLIGRVMWGGTSPGAYLAAGLPNLEGNSDAVGWSDNTLSPSGVFSIGSAEWAGGSLQVVAATGINGAHVVEFRASDGNPIYGNSDTVQPPALTLVPYIKAFSAATNQGMIDLTSLANDIAALDAERLKNIGKVETFAVTEVPAGWMICDGSSVLFADWPEFQQVFNEGRFTGMTLSASDPSQVGKLVLNGSTGVYLPDIIGLYEQASSAANAGGYLAAGLPNIQGRVYGSDSTRGVRTSGQLTSEGAMTIGTGNVGSTSGTVTIYGGELSINAASYNSIYSDSVTTVQPPSVQHVRAMYLGKPNAAAA